MMSPCAHEHTDVHVEFDYCQLQISNSNLNTTLKLDVHMCI